jgi:hypothetical protein
MTVLFLVILLGFAALALDLGRLYVLRTEMQNAADAAALAAAAELDGGDDAIADAVLAATTLLSHQGRFADSPELLKNLSYNPDSPADSAFVFYSWIGAELEDDTIPLHYVCESQEDANKCRTKDSTMAHYVKVKLYPELIDDDAYQISLYFLPVLALFVDDDVVHSASTRVSAVAGAGATICNLPPMMICDPTDDNNNPNPHTMAIGEQVILKQQQGNAWEPGNFGFLEPIGTVADPDDPDYPNGDTLSGNKALAAGLAQVRSPTCSPPRVTTNPGGKGMYPRLGLNTRFGLYDKMFTGHDDKYPAAPNVIDYPRDDALTANPDEKFGCPGGTGTPGCNLDPAIAWLETEDETRPSTYGITDADEIDYNEAFHSGAGQTSVSRFAYYQYELGAGAEGDGWERDENPPTRIANLPDINPAIMLHSNEKQCGNNWLHKDCKLLNGDPQVVPSSPITVSQPSRRVLYVAMLKCNELGITGTTKDINVLEHGQFVKFFLTEHILPPAGGAEDKVDIYAEYLGPVNDKERQELVHTVIQLYE